MILSFKTVCIYSHPHFFQTSNFKKELHLIIRDITLTCINTANIVGLN